MHLLQCFSDPCCNRSVFSCFTWTCPDDNDKGNDKGNGNDNEYGQRNPDLGLFGAESTYLKSEAKSTPPFINSIRIPEGPYIVAGVNSSERVLIPDTSPPLLAADPYMDLYNSTQSQSQSQTNCPHAQPDLKRWHDPNTWGQLGIPQAGRSVTIPQNTKVWIDLTIPYTLRFITVPSTSQLIIGPNPQYDARTEYTDGTGIHIQAHGIQVFGHLIVGAQTCPSLTPVTITLHGNRPGHTVVPPPAEHIKGISVKGGTLSLHGKRYYHTWARLAKTVEIGTNTILIQQPVNWDTGSKIVLVTTAMKDSREWHQNEVLTVHQVYNNPNQMLGALVIVQENTQYRHIANSAYQGEVALLSRTITIQGAPHDSEPTDPDPLTCHSNHHNWWGSTHMPCANKEITGYGGHVMIWHGGKAFVDGVQLYRMGQTNVLGRYPMHFHLLGDHCSTCYFKSSTIWRSFYRCISIHATNQITVQENVAYDVTGYCYYLEDGVEQNNTIAYNLAAHVHIIGEPAWGTGQKIEPVVERDDLILPADITASGFYITNVHNRIVGNAASGGWAGFAFPNLPQALQTHRQLNFRPSIVTSLEIDGNTAHSTGWWWDHAGGFYFGGVLYYNSQDKLEYNAGRDWNFTDHGRWPCKINSCELLSACYKCNYNDQAWNRVSNSKVFLVPGVAYNSWHGRMEVEGIEAHDVGLALESLSNGFWLKDMLAVCRTGEPIAMPPGASMTRVRGDGFFWYDTNQEHIITDSTFRNCGYRSLQYDQYDASPDRGCSNDPYSGCSSQSSVFGFRVHSDQHTPEVMQGTKNITFENCGRRFYLFNFLGTDAPITVSGRGQGWLDVDGSAANTGFPTLIGSGFGDVKDWWGVDDEVVYDPQGPLRFVRQQRERGIGHISLSWAGLIHDQVGDELCGNGNGASCPRVGTIRHMGPKFSPHAGNAEAMVVTANADIVGPVGGFGWLLELDEGAPKTLRVDIPEIMPDTPLLLSIAYPLGTSVNITQHAARWCRANSEFSCSEPFSSVDSVAEVRNGLGNTYHLGSDGLLTLRIIQGPRDFVGRPDWFLPSYDDPGRNGGFAWARFERGGVILPLVQTGPHLLIEADCEVGETRSAYCRDYPSRLDPDVCPTGYNQTAFDACCRTSDGRSGTECVYASGPSEEEEP
ncbi:G8 domain-containing protein DDB [Seminavis robusta]|uniref:G8 domain-containing protein DDB n=1 Tax=Seminavis robusta TaxID=568900 RepID=A0A9N8DP42_9STRA|nr:G8 domain-containing protein DDB [Seminavis robusta]|eukprot:Sro270_g104270.1 G8 domain-containing protein DDB (1155) ;mRNA; f:46176-49850